MSIAIHFVHTAFMATGSKRNNDYIIRVYESYTYTYRATSIKYIHGLCMNTVYTEYNGVFKLRNSSWSQNLTDGSHLHVGTYNSIFRRIHNVRGIYRTAYNYVSRLVSSQFVCTWDSQVHTN